MTAVSPGAGGFVDVNEDPSGLPAVGTLEITTSSVIERVRYDQVDAANLRVRVATAGRGADGTTAASHNVNDAVTNGEQIRAGVALFNNREDDIDALSNGLRQRFDRVEIEMQGCVAMFRAS